MKTRVILSIIAALAVLAWANPASAASTRRITFTNNTGQQANDLHIEFRQSVNPQPPAGPWGPFPNENGSGTTRIDFSGGTVNNGGSAAITFKSTSSRITIRRWWWTLNGQRIGAIMGERAVAMVGFDQDLARVGETLTVDLYALADFGQDASFEVSYSIADPDGLVAWHPPFFLDISAGTGQHQELEVSQAGTLGTYTLSYQAVDLATGEVHEGTSTVDVDSGVFPRLPEESSPSQPVQTVH